MAKAASDIGKPGRGAGKAAKAATARTRPTSPRRQKLWRDLALIAIAPLLLFLLASLVTYSPADPGFSFSGSITAPI